MTAAAVLRPFVAGLAFPEAPRWHDGALWFSDFCFQRVQRAAPDGTPDTVVELDDQPSGLGWLPDGRLIVAESYGKRLTALDVRPDGLHGRRVWATFAGKGVAPDGTPHPLRHHGPGDGDARGGPRRGRGRHPAGLPRRYPSILHHRELT